MATVAEVEPEQARQAQRVVHVKGAGGVGYLEVTHDISEWCCAAVFAGVGRRTRVLLRCSTVGGTHLLADTMRDVHGFAVRHFTADGLWDLVGHDTPVFFINDAVMFPSFIHTQHRDPVTHRKDPDMFWDLITLRPETMHQVSLLFSDRGTPDGYRHMNGYGSHAFKLVNDAGRHVWAKFHYKTDQGIRNLPVDRAEELTVLDPNYCIRDMDRAIAAGERPSWTLYIQVMTPAEAARCPWDPFDLTRVWPHADYPLRPVARMVLEHSADHHLIDQVAFSPANMPPGIAASPDRMLQARLFSYEDTQEHLVSPSVSELSSDSPDPVPTESGYGSVDAATARAERDAEEDYGHGDSGPLGSVDDCPEAAESARTSAPAEPNHDQLLTFWRRVLDDAGRQRLVDNMAADACGAQLFIQARIVRNWSMVSEDFGAKILEALLQRICPADAEELKYSLQ